MILGKNVCHACYDERYVLANCLQSPLTIVIFCICYINKYYHFSVIYVESARTFPKNISFGTGSSAYQSEGSWNVDGKSENIWDRWIHSDPSRIKNNDTADFACDSYTWTLMDADLARRLAVQHYRLSISWSR